MYMNMLLIDCGQRAIEFNVPLAECLLLLLTAGCSAVSAAAADDDDDG